MTDRTPESIRDVCAWALGFTPEEITTPSRLPEYVAARYAVVWHAHRAGFTDRHTAAAIGRERSACPKARRVLGTAPTIMMLDALRVTTRALETP